MKRSRRTTCSGEARRVLRAGCNRGSAKSASDRTTDDEQSVIQIGMLTGAGRDLSR